MQTHTSTYIIQPSTHGGDTITNNPAITSLGASQDNWCYDSWDAVCVNQSMINTNNTNMGSMNASGDKLMARYDDNMDFEDGDRLQWYGYGNYYNWYAATAGNGTYGLDQDGDVAAGDICPAGWHLPSGSASGEFYALNTAVNSGATSTDSGLITYPVNYVYSGSWNGEGGAANLGFGGSYWSRTANNSYYAFALEIVGAVRPGNMERNKSNGFTVRCVKSGL